MADTITGQGGNVSRVLSASEYQFTDVVYQKRRPPLDAEITLTGGVAADRSKRVTKLTVPASGWLDDGSQSRAVFQTDPTHSNKFAFGYPDRPVYAVVDGEVIPVAGTDITSPGDNLNWIKLPPPGAVDARVDVVFLETWRALVSPNPSTTNKPSATTLHRYGNVLYGNAGSNPADDIKDTSIGIETTKRVQLQYRIRVVSLTKLSLQNNPDGMLNANVLAQANQTNPVAGKLYYMSPSDHGLWLAGWSGAAPASNVLAAGVTADPDTNGTGTVDGWVKSIPLCAVFRRGTSAYDATGDGKGFGVNRNNLATAASDATTFIDVATLTGNITNAVTSIALSALVTAGLPTNGGTVRINDELIRYTGVNANTITGCTRGYGGTIARAHKTADAVTLIAGVSPNAGTVRPDGLFSDQIADQDIVDLRHMVGVGMNGLLRKAFTKLVRGETRATWKMDHQDSTSVGSTVLSADRFSTEAADPPGAYKITEAPNGSRFLWSDAAHMWRHHMVPIKPNGSTITPGVHADVSAVDPNYQLSNYDVRIVKQLLANKFSVGDIFRIKIDSLRTGWDSTNPIRFMMPTTVLDGDGDSGANEGRGRKADMVSMWWDGEPAAGETQNIDSNIEIGDDNHLQVKRIAKTVAMADTAANSTQEPSDVFDDLVITLAGGWPGAPASAGNGLDFTFRTYLRFTTITEGGRGLSRLPEQVLSIRVETPHNDILLRPDGEIKPKPIQTWTEQNNDRYLANDPVVSTAYADPASKTVMLRPWQQLTFPALQARAAADAPGGVLMPVTGAPQAGSFPNKGATDPLALFDKNRFVHVPPGVFPTLGTDADTKYLGIDVPVLPAVPSAVYNGGTFGSGINCFLQAGHTETVNPSLLDYPIAPQNNPYVTFLTHTLDTPPIAAGFNQAVGAQNLKRVGAKLVTATDTPWKRAGIQLPPFYGIARLWGVYEVVDYRDNGTPIDPTNRDFLADTSGKATNLLRDDNENPPLWFWMDADNDGSFVLDEGMVDIARSPNAIASFGTGQYVVEATIFGFTRGFLMEPTVPASPNPLSYPDPQLLVVRSGAAGGVVADATWSNRTLGAGAGDLCRLVVPGPMRGAASPESSDMVVTYSRRPYGGDPIRGNIDRVDGRGPFPTASWFFMNTPLTEANVTLTNPTGFEVLDAIGFATTAGTGRISGIFDIQNHNSPLDVGHELPTDYPVADGQVTSLAKVLGGWINTTYGVYGDAHGGVTSRLPIGRLYRDKDFIGQQLNAGGNISSFTFIPLTGDAPPTSGDFAPNGPRSVVRYTIGDLIALVDGSDTDNSDTTFRTGRGGTGFVLGGPRPGGLLSAVVGSFATIASDRMLSSVMFGVAALVRNMEEKSGAAVLHRGGELQLVVITKALRGTNATNVAGRMVLHTSPMGVGEGSTAVDRFRIDGHPLVHLPARMLDPTTVTLAPRD